MTPSRESVLDRVKAAHQRAATAKHLDVDVPGYGGDLVLRLGAVGWDTTNEVIAKNRAAGTANTRAGRPTRGDWNAAADMVIRGTRDVMLRVDDALEPISPDGATGINRDLMVLLGMEQRDTARECLLALFAPANDPDMAILDVSHAFQEWLAEGDAEATAAAMGESAATPA